MLLLTIGDDGDKANTWLCRWIVSNGMDSPRRWCRDVLKTTAEGIVEVADKLTFFYAVIRLDEAFEPSSKVS
jgi:hypothetical protein